MRTSERPRRTNPGGGGVCCCCCMACCTTAGRHCRPIGQRESSALGGRRCAMACSRDGRTHGGRTRRCSCAAPRHQTPINPESVLLLRRVEPFVPAQSLSAFSLAKPSAPSTTRAAPRRARAPRDCAIEPLLHSSNAQFVAPPAARSARPRGGVGLPGPFLHAIELCAPAPSQPPPGCQLDDNKGSLYIMDFTRRAG